MDKEPDRANMIGKFLGERERFPHQARTALRKGIVQAFDEGGMIGFRAVIVSEPPRLPLAD